MINQPKFTSGSDPELSTTAKDGDRMALGSLQLAHSDLKGTMKKASFVLTILFFAAITLNSTAQAQGTTPRRKMLTNADIVRRAQLGDSDSKLIDAIRHYQTAFDFDRASVAALNGAGITAEVQLAMFDSYLRNGTPKSNDAPLAQDRTVKPSDAPAPSSPAATPPVVAPPATPSTGAVIQSSGAATAQSADIARNAAINAALGSPAITPVGQPRRVNSTSQSHPSRQMRLNWQSVSTHEIYETGNYSFIVNDVNDIICQYELTVTLNPASTTDNIKLLADALKTSVTPAPERAEDVNVCDALRSLYGAANTRASAIQAALLALLPSKQPDGKYPSIPLNQTLNQWDGIKSQIPSYVSGLQALQTELDSNRCTSAASPDLVAKAAQLILDYTSIIRPKLEIVDAAANGNHSLIGEGYLDRTRGGSVIVKELFAGVETSASPHTFPLEATFSVVTASGGFLLTTLPARSYSVVNQPPSTTGGSTTSVLGVSGGSPIRPALTALLNFHDPFPWFLNKPNFGFAISAGPVIEVANGQADTSKFGFFGGISVHLWKQLFLTPGVHVGEFADFPQGFAKAGDAIPANFGTLAPTKRYSARFGFAVAFRGSNPTSLLGTGSQKTSSTTTPSNTSSGPKQ